MENNKHKIGLLFPVLWLTLVPIFTYFIGWDLACTKFAINPLVFATILIASVLIAFTIGLFNFKNNSKLLQSALILLFIINILLFGYLILAASVAACAEGGWQTWQF